MSPAFATDVEPPATLSETIESLPEAELDRAEFSGEADEDGTETRQISEPVEADLDFSMIGFTLPADSDTDEVTVRTRNPEGDWTAWEPLGIEEPGVDGPDLESLEAAEASPAASEPLWVGAADAFQVGIEGEVADIVATLIDSDGLNESLTQRAIRILRPRVAQAPAEAALKQPNVISRSQWGADESIRRANPSYASNVSFAVAHHTAGSNNYTRASSPAVVRGIYEWHVNGNGWSDIGYNILIDKYGQVFEGRYGGLDRGVIGAHAAGFNTGSFGVGVLGNYELVDLSAAAATAFTQVIAWKYDMHGIDPDPGRRISVNGRSIRTLSGHRDVGATACPGRYFAARMPTMRNVIQDLVTTGQHNTTTASVPVGSVPVVGDWSGDGRVQPGWRVGNRFYLPIGPGGETRSFRYGQTGDTPVVGDWNGNGRDGIGVHRDNLWYLRNSLSAGASDHHFVYGRAGDQPVSGDWNRSGRDGIGVFRNGTWYVRNELSAGASWRYFTYGRAGDQAITGDWQGLNRDGIGVRRGSSWYLRSHLNAGPSAFYFPFGRETDLPITGDFNGNGRSSAGIVRQDDWRASNRLPARSPDHTLLYAPTDTTPR